MTDEPAEPSPFDPSRHDAPNELTREDVPAVAALFNQIGSDLTQVTHMQVEGGARPAMQLDSNKLLPAHLQPNAAPPQPPPQPQPQPVTHTPQAPSQSPPVPPVGTTVVVGHNEYEKQKKQVTALKRKVTKLDKDLQALREVVKVPNSSVKYKLTSSNIDCVCNNINTLIDAFLAEVANRATDITITKC